MRSLASIRDAALRALYPLSCAACDRPLETPTGLCPRCMESALPIETACPGCARPVAGARPVRCAPCRRSPSVLHHCTACFEYGGQVAVALRRLKFAGRNDIARSLRPMLAAPFARASVGCDLALPVPLHRSRLRKRGFNQAQRLLVPLAAELGLPRQPSALIRTRSTPPQSRLPRAQRVANLRGAFHAQPSVVGKTILLLDDVRTTGATLEAAAMALLDAGAREIHGFVVARTE